MKEEKYCPECNWYQSGISDEKHFWWCPAQTDAELLRILVIKVKELLEKFNF